MSSHLAEVLSMKSLLNSIILPFAVANFRDRLIALQSKIVYKPAIMDKGVEKIYQN